MIHLLIMVLFAAMVSLIFGLFGRDSTKDRLYYGLKVFAEFVGIGLGLAWLLYFFPF